MKTKTDSCRGDWRWPRFYEIRPLALVVNLVSLWVLVSSFYTQHSYSTQLHPYSSYEERGPGSGCLMWTSELCWFTSPEATSRCEWRRGASDLGEVSTAPHHRLTYTDTVTANPLGSINLCVWGWCFINSSVTGRNSHISCRSRLDTVAKS